MRKYVSKKGTVVVCLNNLVSNVFLVDNGTHLLLIDTSVLLCRGQIEKQISNYSDREPVAIFQTHNHYDHTQNTAYFQGKYKCPVYIHLKEKTEFERGVCIVSEGTVWHTRCISFLFRGLHLFENYLKPMEPVLGITSGTLIEHFENQIRIIETPGHTAGSVSLIIDDEFVIVGDAMRNRRKKTYPLLGDDEELMCDSLERLLRIPCRIFFPSHGMEFGHPQSSFEG